jgi:hypothetical protein
MSGVDAAKGAPSELSTRRCSEATLVTNEPNYYQIRVLDSRVFAILSATLAAVTIGHCYHI